MSNLQVFRNADVVAFLEANRADILDVVTHAYLEYERGNVTEGDHSFFLPERPNAIERAITLPAYSHATDTVGLKWIASSLTNRSRNLPRASGVVVLSDGVTGVPRALLPAGALSIARTAASAIVALSTCDLPPDIRIGVVGAGRLAREVLEYFFARPTAPNVAEIVCHDLDPGVADRFAESLTWAGRTHAGSGLDDALRTDVVILTTTARTPYIEAFPGADTPLLVLHLSLRDLFASALTPFEIIVDDVELATSGTTSLAEFLRSNPRRRSDLWTLGRVLDGGRRTMTPACFCPFGLAALDLFVADYVSEALTRMGSYKEIDDFET